jgi:hypothetical protein
MLQNIITELTPEQEALIPVYREKWKAIALFTKPIDCQKAAEAIKAAYALIGEKEPKILFFDSPYAALNTVVSLVLTDQLDSELGRELKSKLENYLWTQPRTQLQTQLADPLRRQLWAQLRRNLWNQIGNQELEYQLRNQFYNHLRHYAWKQLGSDAWLEQKQQLRQQLDNCLQRETWVCNSSWIDFCISILSCSHDPIKWQTLQLLILSCGWIIPWEKTCIVCNNPLKISLDNQNRFHAEGEPAIQFADRYGLYSHHGVTIPEKYGTLSPTRWRSRWLLEEGNAELRRVLIQGIGYARICYELQATELDSWQEYTLLKIDDADVEPIYLLKMTCPSTERIHVMRVPPTMKSAREAITWVNLGVAPEEFSMQT